MATKQAVKAEGHQIGTSRLDTRRRDVILLKEKLKGKSNKAALTAAGYSVTTIKQQGPMRRINGELCAEMERQGLTVQAFAGHIIEGLKATAPIIRKGEIVPGSEGMEDWRTRSTYARLTADVSGDIASRKVELSGSATLDVNVKREEATAVWGKLGVDD